MLYQEFILEWNSLIILDFFDFEIVNDVEILYKKNVVIDYIFEEYENFLYVVFLVRILYLSIVFFCKFKYSFDIF